MGYLFSVQRKRIGTRDLYAHKAANVTRVALKKDDLVALGSTRIQSGVGFALTVAKHAKRLAHKRLIFFGSNCALYGQKTLEACAFDLGRHLILTRGGRGTDPRRIDKRIQHIKSHTLQHRQRGLKILVALTRETHDDVRGQGNVGHFLPHIVHNRKIPLGVAADFLDMNEEGLKAALMRGNAPFGFAYQKTDGAYRVMVIPTVTFYLWYTNTTGQMVMQGEITARK